MKNALYATIFFFVLLMSVVWGGFWYLGNGVGNSHSWAKIPIIVSCVVSGIAFIVCGDSL